MRIAHTVDAAQKRSHKVALWLAAVVVRVHDFFPHILPYEVGASAGLGFAECVERSLCSKRIPGRSLYA
jgi:hypothetical protein